MSASIKRQDASGHMPVAVCLDGKVLDLVPTGTDYQSDDARAALFAATAAETGVDVNRLEILVVCHKHPTSSAVDCIDCEPVDSAPNPGGGS